MEDELHKKQFAISVIEDGNDDDLLTEVVKHCVKNNDFSTLFKITVKYPLSCSLTVLLSNVVSLKLFFIYVRKEALVCSSDFLERAFNLIRSEKSFQKESESLMFFLGAAAVNSNFLALYQKIHKHLKTDDNKFKLRILFLKSTTKFDELDDFFIKKIEQFPNKAWLKIKYIQELKLQNRYDEAQDFIQIQLDSTVHKELFLFELGLIYSLRQNPDAAEKYFFESWVFKKTVKTAIKLINLYCDKATDLEEVQDVADWLSIKHHENTTVLRVLIRYNNLSFDIEKSRQLLEKRKSLIKDSYNLILEANICISNGEFDQVFALYKDHKKHVLSDPHLMKTFAALAIRRGEVAVLNEIFSLFKSVYNDNGELILVYGRFLQRQGKSEEVFSLLVDCTFASNVLESQRLACLGHAYQDVFDLENAIQCFEAAYALNPRMYSMFIQASFLKMFFLDFKDANLVFGSSDNGLQSLGSFRFGFFSRFYNEFVLNSSALDNLTRMGFAINSIQSVEILRDVIRDDPNYVLNYFLYFIIARRFGKIPTVNINNNGFRNKIPSNVFQFWDDDMPPIDIVSMMNTWRVNCNDFRYTKLNEKQAIIFLSRFSSLAMKAFIKAPHAAMKSDLLRLALIYNYGGFYVDADDRCLSSLSDLLKIDCELLFFQESVGSIGNNFFAATKRHPFVLDLLNEAIKNILDNPHDDVWFATGPGMFTKILGHSLLNDKLAHKDVGILTLNDLHKFAWIHTSNSYKSTDDNWQRA